MVLTKIGPVDRSRVPLELVDRPIPIPGDKEILVRVTACGVCHTELDEIEGRTPPPGLPVIPGHQVIGRVEKRGSMAKKLQEGDRVGIAWIYSSCGTCRYCLEGRENLCPDFKGTGRDADGGYAEYIIVSEEFAYPIPDEFSDMEAAPLLCAGAVGYRSLRLAGIRDGFKIGLTGFGASGHIVLKTIQYQYPRSRVFVFARSGNERVFAEELGAFWTGDTEERPPEKLDCIIDTTPVWKPILGALQNLVPGGRLVINAIRKENFDRESFLKIEYSSHLWLEKEIKSVANVTKRDVREFLALAAKIPIRPEVQEFSLEGANTALLELKERRIRGAKVLRISF